MCKKTPKKPQFSSVLVPPVYRHQPVPLSLGSMHQCSWKLPIYPPSPPSSHFMSNHSRVRSKLTELLGQLLLSVSPKNIRVGSLSLLQWIATNLKLLSKGSFLVYLLMLGWCSAEHVLRPLVFHFHVLLSCKRVHCTFVQLQ